MKCVPTQRINLEMEGDEEFEVFLQNPQRASIDDALGRVKVPRLR